MHCQEFFCQIFVQSADSKHSGKPRRLFVLRNAKGYHPAQIKTPARGYSHGRSRGIGVAQSGFRILTAAIEPSVNWGLLGACRFLRRPGEPHDVQSRAGPVGHVNQAAVVNIDVVGLNDLDAIGSDLGIAIGMADTIRAERLRVLVWRRNEVADFLRRRRDRGCQRCASRR